jgi:hypothetical protein
MRRLWSHRPSPALIVSGIALFASLGGTGYAAARLSSPATDAASKNKHKAPAKPLSKSQVNKLIAAYLSAHHGLRGVGGAQGLPGAQGVQGAQGAQGSAGAQGGIGGIGPQGPGAQQIVASQRAEVASTPVASFGLWTMALACAKGPEATITFTGPGSVVYTRSFGTAGGKAETVNNKTVLGGGGLSLPLSGTGQQMDVHGFLISGSTMEQVSLEVTVTGPLIIECTVTGDAIPVP